MFEIKPIESKERQKAICAQCGVPYRDDCFAYSAIEEDRLLGICQFKIKDDIGYMY